MSAVGLWVIILSVVALLIIVGLIVRKYASRIQGLSPKEQHEIVVSYLDTVLKLAAGLALFLTLITTLDTLSLTQKNTEVAQQTLESSKQTQFSDRYAKAVEMLNSPDRGVRVGAMYALQRLMKDSPQDQVTIINVLATFVRTNASRPDKPWTPNVEVDDCFGGTQAPEPPADIQTALTVLASRDSTPEGGGDRFQLDLHGAYMVGARLNKANLKWVILDGADLSGAELEGANMEGAHLRRSRLVHACMESANLSMAQIDGGTRLDHASLRDAKLDEVSMFCVSLAGADLTGAQFEAIPNQLPRRMITPWQLGNVRLDGAQLDGANLQGVGLADVTLKNATMTGAKLQKANLRRVYELTDAQLSEAETDAKTIRPNVAGPLTLMPSCVLDDI